MTRFVRFALHGFVWTRVRFGWISRSVPEPPPLQTPQSRRRRHRRPKCDASKYFFSVRQWPFCSCFTSGEVKHKSFASALTDPAENRTSIGTSRAHCCFLCCGDGTKFKALPLSMVEILAVIIVCVFWIHLRSRPIKQGLDARRGAC